MGRFVGRTGGDGAGKAGQAHRSGVLDEIGIGRQIKHRRVVDAVDGHKKLPGDCVRPAPGGAAVVANGDRDRRRAERVGHRGQPQRPGGSDHLPDRVGNQCRVVGRCRDEQCLRLAPGPETVKGDRPEAGVLAEARRVGCVQGRLIVDRNDRERAGHERTDVAVGVAELKARRPDPRDGIGERVVEADRTEDFLIPGQRVVAGERERPRSGVIAADDRAPGGERQSVAGLKTSQRDRRAGRLGGGGEPEAGRHRHGGAILDILDGGILEVEQDRLVDDRPADPILADASVVRISRARAARPDTGDAQIVRPGHGDGIIDDRGRHRRDAVRGAIVGGKHVPAVIKQLGKNVEVRIAQVGVEIERDTADARRKTEDIKIGGTFDHAGEGQGIFGDDRRRGRGDRVPGIIGTIADAVGGAGDDREVVLRVVGVGILAAAPLRDRQVIPHSHDRRPSGRARSVLALVVLVDESAVVAEAKGVADFVADRLHDVFFTVEQGVGKHVARGLHAPPERIQVSNASGRPIQPVLPPAADTDPLAPASVARSGPPQRLHARVLGGHIHVKRTEILGDALPDGLNAFALVGGKRAGAALKVVSRSLDRAVGEIPIGADRAVPVEVQINDLRRARPAVQGKRVAEGKRGGAGGHRSDEEVRRRPGTKRKGVRSVSRRVDQLATTPARTTISVPPGPGQRRFRVIRRRRVGQRDRPRHDRAAYQPVFQGLQIQQPAIFVSRQVGRKKGERCFHRGALRRKQGRC